MANEDHDEHFDNGQYISWTIHKEAYSIVPAPGVDSVANSREMEEFLGLPPRRIVPRGIYKGVRRATAAKGGFAGFAAVSGCAKILVVLFLLPFIAVGAFFFPWTLPIELLIQLGWRGEAEATITEVEKTSSRVRYNDGPWLDVYRVEFMFDLPDGRTVSARNYVEGKNDLPVEKKVAVRYFPLSPEVAVFAGGRQSSTPIFAAIFGLFPLGAGVWAILAARKRRRLRILLADGEVAAAKVVRVDELDESYRACLEFSCPDGVIHAVVPATEAKAEVFRQRRQDGRTMRILYLPGSTRGVLVLG